MLWLGQPCALPALRPGDLLHLLLHLQPPLGRSVVLREATGRTVPWPTSPVRFWFPGAGAESRGSRGLRPPLAWEGPDPRWLHVQMSLQATGSDFHHPAGGESSGSRKGTGGSPANDPACPSQEDGQKPNKSQQLKKVFKEYGGVAVAFHVSISLVSLGMFYLALSSGVDMTAILFKLGFDEAVVQSKLAAGTSTFLLAYAIHKLFAPVRISITLISVPLLVRYFRKIGFFKPPAPNP